MSSAPYLSNYPTLNSFAVLTRGTLSGTGASTLTVSGSSNYGYDSLSAITVIGGTPVLPPSATYTTALSDLTALISNINNYTATLAQEPIIENNPTFYPNKCYTSNIATSFNGVITLDGQNQLNPQFFIIVNSGMTFDLVTSFVLTGGANPCNIFWVVTGSNDIEFGAGTAAPSTDIYGVFIAGTGQIISGYTGPASFNGRIYTETPAVVGGIDLGSNISISGSQCPEPGPEPVCYAKGTLILTKRGFVPIENIKAGDEVVTKGRIYKNKFIKQQESLKLDDVLWTSKFKVINLNSKTRPICIEKDAFSKNVPFQDLYVSPGHSLLLNGKMVLARDLVNGKTIYQDYKCKDVEYYHLECDYHSGIYANGVLSESYLEMNNRDIFENSVKINKINFKKMF